MPEVRETAAPPRIAVSETSTRLNRTGSWKYIRPRYRDAVAPCNAGCPTGVDIEGYMNLLREGRTAEALSLLLRENPMPAITGRVCHHPCETACNRAGFDEPVAVHLVERALGDEILASPPPELTRTRAEQVAIIGSGPAGLACAYHLARQGYGVTVFEEAAEAGGMLRLGIPPYRLPREVLDRQIEWFRGAGIGIRCGTRVEGDAGRSLLAEYSAVFIATGAHRGRPLGAVGEDGPGVVAGLGFLKAVNGGDRPAIGRHVVVVGGGNTAMDCARTALRLGAGATVVYRRTRQEMPAIAAEIEEAVREGVAFEFLANPRAFHHLAGRLVGVECDRMELGEPDASGRRRPVVAGHGAFSILADTAFIAIGEDADLDALPGGVPVSGGGVVIDELGGTLAGRVFAGGDVANVERTVADALGSGKAAAIGIDRALRSAAGEAFAEDGIADLRWAGGNVSMSRWRGDDPVRRTDAVNQVVPVDALNMAHFQHSPRHDEHVAGPGDPVRALDFAEVNRGLLPDEALAEACRCFNCGVCNQCELCLIFCPDVAISRDPAGTGFEIDLNYCKGCGVCAVECPRGAIVMTREGL
jgi:NADPH-dependent glutamate synthase beta subunit-like oxidoreductase/Pyruvate/2-oxoacid:ferredoxin oxidoreductase delta subunit